MIRPVHAARVAMIAGLLAAAYVVSLYLVRTVPDWAIAALGGPSRPIDRWGGLALTFRPAPGDEAAFDRYVADRANTVRKEAGKVIVEIPGVPEAAAMETLDLLQYGGMTMKEVVRNNYAAEIGERDGVTLDVDQWHVDETGEIKTDTFLRAASAELLAEATAGYAPPAGTEIAFEWVEPPAYGVPPYVRTYLVRSVADIDASMIASAMRSYDPTTNRPLVLLDFTPAGGERFCELTARITGEKLATMAGRRVQSAPIINGKICGGRASVMIGGSDPVREEQQADALVAVLRSGVMPRGTIEAHAWTPPANIARQAWLARLLLGAIAGIVAGLLVYLALRLVKPSQRAPRYGAGQFPWRRVAVTALAPIAILAGTQLQLPGLNEPELEQILRRSLGVGESVIALGLTPIIAGYLLVELAALAWPRLRWRRHDPRGRIALGRAAAVVALVIALLQGYFAATYWSELALLSRVDVTAHHGWQLKVLYTLTLAAGTMGLALIAGIIREHGLGNGFAAVLAASYLFDLAAPYTREGYANFHHFVTRETLVGLTGALVVAFATRSMLRWRIDKHRLPTCGITPLADSLGIVMILVMLASLGLSGFERTIERYYAFVGNHVVHAAILFASVPVWAWLFARPSLLVGGTLAGWLRATALTLVAFVAFWIVGPLHALAIIVVTAAALDIVDDLRAHRDKLAIAGVVHQAQYVPMLEQALDAANIPAHFHASHIRTVFAFFGAWAPIHVLVPAAHVEEATTLVYATISKEHHAMVQAFA